MEISTLFDIGDTVWFPYNNKYYEGLVESIDAWEFNTDFIYTVKYCNSASGACFTSRVYEHELYAFDDKDAIIKTLFKYTTA